jgi:hypothetical protein
MLRMLRTMLSQRDYALLEFKRVMIWWVAGRFIAWRAPSMSVPEQPKAINRPATHQIMTAFNY